MTVLTSVRGLRPAEFFADPNHIYIGRGVCRSGWPSSVWGNPFRPDPGDSGADRRRALEDCVRLFEDRLGRALDRLHTRGPGPHALYGADARFAEMARRLPELHNCILGCWCGTYPGEGETDVICHGVTLCRLVNAMDVPAGGPSPGPNPATSGAG